MADPTVGDPGPGDAGGGDTTSTSARAIAGRSTWVIGDQVFSSITNFALAVLVARNVDTEEFGAFGVAFAVYIFFMALSTGMWSAPVAVTHAGSPPERRLEQIARSAGAALVSGAGIGVPLLGVALLIGGPTAAALVPIAVLLPGLLLQNAWRHGFIIHAQPQRAVVNDVVWGVLQIGGVLLVVTAVEDPTAGQLVAAWAVAGALAGVLGSIQARRLPRLRGLAALARENRHLGPNFAGEAFVMQGQSQVTLIALAAISGSTATAGYRGAQVAFGPQRVLSNGLATAALPEAVRVRHDRVRLRRATLALSGVNTVIVIAIGTVLLVMPESFGTAFLGDSWEVTRPVILPMTLFGVTGTIASGPSVGLRAIGQASACLRNQLIASPLALVATIVGMLGGGAVGAAWGLAAAGTVSALIWQVSWRTRFREYEPRNAA